MKAPAMIVMLLFLAVPAKSQVINGGFTQGRFGWTVDTFGGGCPAFPDSGFDGTIQFISPFASSCGKLLGQTVRCGSSAGCVLSVDYRDIAFDTEWGTASTLQIYVGSELVFSKGRLSERLPQWRTFTVPFPKGDHEFRIGVSTVFGSVAEIDNVRLGELVPVAPVTWGSIKARWKN